MQLNTQRRSNQRCFSVFTPPPISSAAAPGRSFRNAVTKKPAGVVGAGPTVCAAAHGSAGGTGPGSRVVVIIPKSPVVTSLS